VTCTPFEVATFDFRFRARTACFVETWGGGSGIKVIWDSSIGVGGMRSSELTSLNVESDSLDIAKMVQGH